MNIFLSTPSARRATLWSKRPATQQFDFYPRPPRGGRRKIWQFVAKSFRISIHALREEGDQVQVPQTAGPRDFYPRPPRGGRQRGGLHCKRHAGKFLSTPSARRATIFLIMGHKHERDFYPRPPRGGRPLKLWSDEAAELFLSTPSARRATGSIISITSSSGFLSTPSARWATPQKSKSNRNRGNFYPRPPRGGRRRMLPHQ